MPVLAVLKSLAILMVVILLWNARTHTKGVTQARKLSTDPEIAKISGTITEVRSKNGRSLVMLEIREGRFLWVLLREAMLEVGDRLSFEVTVPHYHYFAADFGLNLPECYIVNVFDVQPGEEAIV